MKRSVTDYPLAGKRVLVRVDFNVPLEDGRVGDDTRIRAALPTIDYLLDQGCPVVLASHLGRPKGQVVEGLRMAPVAARLAELLGRPVATAADCVGPDVEAAAAALAPGDVLLLENLRFHAEETANDARFARELAGLAEVYVNDAFGTAHRAHASTEGVTHLPAVRRGAAPDARARDPRAAAARPGAPVRRRARRAQGLRQDRLIENMLGLADTILVGGAMANAFLKAQGCEIGRSKGDGEQVGVAADALAAAGRAAGELLLPVDVVVAPSPEAGAEAHTVAVEGIGGDDMALDIGARTIAAFESRLGGAGTIYWNGPMGLFEVDDFAAGTRAVGEAIAASPAVTVVGGGDTVAAVRAFGLEGRLDPRLHRRRRVDGVPRGPRPARRRGADGR